MLKDTDKILIVVTVLCVIVSGTLCLGAYKATKITFTISGSTGISGVVMNGLPGNPVTDEKGNYTATVDYGWSGTVTPMKEGYTFEPTDKTYDSVMANQTNQNYAATLLTYTISGSVGIDGVVMEGLPGEPVTDRNGNYTATVGYGFSGRVTPTKEGYIFKPADRKYANVTDSQTNQNYTGTLLSFTISGMITFDGAPLEDVLVSADNGGGTDTTNANGQYTITVDYGWSGTVTPTKEGYTFDVPYKRYTDVTGSQGNQDYTATVVTCIISGTVTSDTLPLSGVVMNGLPGDPVTNGNGYYHATVVYGWSSVITPTKEGYTFKPANVTYERVTAHQTQNYTATLLTYTISGSVGMSGVMMKGLPGDPVSDVNGNYTATVDYGWGGTVTPTKEGYAFKPDNRIYDSVTKDQTRNHTAELLSFIISGKVVNDLARSGVVMKGLPGDPVTNENGYYSAIVDYGWNGTVTPMKEGCTFEPAEKIYTKVTADQPQDYTATLLTFTISGTITSDGKPIEGVLVSADKGGGSGKTNANGQYELSVKYGWSGAVTPTKEGYTFDTVKRRYTNITDDQDNQNYSATLLTCTISGTIMFDGRPIEGVLVSASNGGGSDTTNAKGRYAVTVDYGFSGTVTPTKPGYIFSPPSKKYVNVTSDIDEDEIQRRAERKEAERSAAEHRAAEERATAERAKLEAAKIKAAELEAAAEPEAAELKPTEQESAKPEIAKPKAPMPEITKLEAAAEPEVAEREAVEKPAGQALVSNVFIDTDLRQVLQDIASQVGVTIIPDQTITGLITCELKDVPLEKALEIVLAGTGYIVKTTPDYYLVCSPNPKDAAFPASSQTRSVKLNYIGAEAAVKLLSPIFKNYIQADATTGTVCITASLPLMDRIIADLELIDRPPRHVMLNARIVVMKRDDLLNLGIKWGWPKIRAGVFSNSYLHGGGSPATGAKWPWGIQIGYTSNKTFTNALELTLNLLEQNGEATIVSSPQVLAQDGKEAEIKVTTEQYYSLLPEVAGDGAYYYYQRAELRKIEYGTVLNITPHIGANGDITLDLAIEVSDVVARTTDEYPIVTRRTVRNTMRIKDGGTVSVAGLKKNETYSTKSNVPGLANLPILGGLFQDKDNKEISQEVAIFVTAHLIPDSDVTQRFTEPTTEQAPIEPADSEEFKLKLQELLDTDE